MLNNHRTLGSIILHGLGDIDIREVDLLNLFWEPGIKDIQKSGNLFHVDLVDKDLLEQQYPFLKANASSPTIDVAKYVHDDSIDTSNKSAVVDWYYKRVGADGRTVLHYAKFTGDVLLYASENDPAYAERGWYDHGLYPIVLDILYPEEGSAAGYGLIAVGRNPQGYIDELDGHILEYANAASRVRYWAKRSLGVNEKEFLDPDRRIIEVEGDIDEEKLRQIEITPIDDSVIDIKRLKIEELKEITGSRDVSQGGVSGSVTAASAISILREAGAKSSRDGIAETYRAYIKMMALVIELIRQFYDTDRIFRVTGESGEREYLAFSGKMLKQDETGRRPYFDIEINATKKSPTEAQQKNQFAKELYDAGAFKSENVKETLMMLELMDFEGIGKLKASLRSLPQKAESI